MQSTVVHRYPERLTTQLPSTARPSIIEINLNPSAENDPILFIIYFTMDGLDIDDDSFVQLSTLTHS